jgi:hypothetical protein
MDICICISGQVRGDFKALKHLKKELDKLPSNVELTIIFSVWDMLGFKVNGPLDFLQLHRIFDDELAKVIPSSLHGEKLWFELPDTYKKLSSNDVEVVNEIYKIFPSAVIDIEKEILDLEFLNNTHDKNSKRMLYKRWRANEIKKKLERDRSKEFELVLLLRPDVFIDIYPDKVLSFYSEGKELFSPKTNNNECINDLFSYGTSSSIDFYTSVFCKAIEYKEWGFIHHVLFEYLESNSFVNKDASAFVSKDLEKPKLISYEDCKGESELLDFIYSESYNDSIVSSADTDVICSVNILRFLKSSDGSFSRSIAHLLRADLYFFDLNKVKRLKREFILSEIQKWTIENRMSSREFISNIDFKDNHILISNLQRSGIFDEIDGVFFEEVELYIKNSDFEKLVYCSKNNMLPDCCANLIRDFSIQCAEFDLEQACFLMGLAKEIRPTGKFIEDRYYQYINLLEEKI